MKKNIMNIIVMTLGAMIAAFSLEGFLIPNKIIDGGILGIAIMTNYKTQFPLGWCIFILNLPFIFLALQKMGKAFVAFTFYAVTVLSIGVSLMPVWLNHKHVSDPFLACIFGGLILGAGVGLVLRSNSSLDGTEILSISLSKKWGFSVGEIIMFFNLFIFTAAGFVYGNWQSSMYSMISYFIAYRVIDIVIEGLNEWFATVQGLLDEDVAGRLINKTSDLDERLTALEYMIIHNDLFTHVVDDDGNPILDDDGNAIISDWKYKTA